MKTVNVKWGVNVSNGNENISIEELGCETMEEWEAHDETEQRCRLQEALNDLPERVNIVVDSW